MNGISNPTIVQQSDYTYKVHVHFTVHPETYRGSPAPSMKVLYASNDLLDACGYASTAVKAVKDFYGHYLTINAVEVWNRVDCILRAVPSPKGGYEQAMTDFEGSGMGGPKDE